jgi:hypothetical protein
LLLLATEANAQGPRRSAHFDLPAPRLQPLVQQTAPVGNMMFGGLVGGAIGFFAFGFAGALIADSQADEGGDGFEALGGFVIGAVIGESLMLPLGVHVANKRRGDYALELLASAAIAGAGVGLTAAMEDMGIVFLPAIPIAQMAASIAIERGATP